MEMAKVTSKGQITIPISIRRRLGINEGDKILFVNKQEGVLMLNPDAVQGDIAELTADAVPLEVPAAPAAAPKGAQSSAQKKAAAAAPAGAGAADAEEPAAPAAPEKPPERKYIPPVAEDTPKPAASAGGIDLSTLLDDIRSIGSNI